MRIVPARRARASLGACGFFSGEGAPVRTRTTPGRALNHARSCLEPRPVVLPYVVALERCRGSSGGRCGSPCARSAADRTSGAHEVLRSIPTSISNTSRACGAWKPSEAWTPWTAWAPSLAVGGSRGRLRRTSASSALPTGGSDSTEGVLATQSSPWSDAPEAARARLPTPPSPAALMEAWSDAATPPARRSHAAHRARASPAQTTPGDPRPAPHSPTGSRSPA